MMTRRIVETIVELELEGSISVGGENGARFEISFKVQEADCEKD